MIEETTATLEPETEEITASSLREDRIVVRTLDGSTIKGTFEWHFPSDGPCPIQSLPDALTLRDISTGDMSTVALSTVKAVFFVRTYAGDASYDEVRFFHERTPSDLWIKVLLLDGEFLEGRTDNSVGLLVEPGIWLWPVDSVTNNLRVYVPKTSVTEFYIMGLASPRRAQQKELARWPGFMCSEVD